MTQLHNKLSYAGSQLEHLFFQKTVQEIQSLYGSLGWSNPQNPTRDLSPFTAILDGNPFNGSGRWTDRIMCAVAKQQNSKMGVLSFVDFVKLCHES